MAESQHQMELKRKKERQILHEELRAYHKLKNAWALGYIRWTHCQLKGFYVDSEKKKKEVFLGNSLRQAHQRLNHVKSFL